MRMAVGNLHPIVERNVSVGPACQHALDAFILEKLFQPERHSQRRVLFLHTIPRRSFVNAAMTGIKNDGIECIRRRSRQKRQKQRAKGGYCSRKFHDRSNSI